MIVMMPDTCPFCSLPAERIIVTNEHALAIRDAFPVSDGHTLVLPRRHIESWFDTTNVEKNALFSLIDYVKISIDIEYEPDAYNIGINDGSAAGQTIFHLHLHVIPRYLGDRTDPRGGVRWLLPEKARYW